MYISAADEKININVSDLVSVSCRERERFRRFDNALKDEPAFALSVVERSEKKDGNSYYPETKLSCTLKLCGASVELSGKISVLIKNDTYTVDCVRSLRYPLRLVDENFISDWHNEAKCLAFILAQKRNLNKVGVRISVFHTETLEKKEFIFEYSYSELELFFKNILALYSRYFEFNLIHINSRNDKNSTAPFPFDNPRDGQSEIGKEVFSAIKNKHNLIVNAPTGLGKTVATLYPAVKAQGKALCDKIFYLTAKNSGVVSVLDAIRLFEKSGYDLTVCVVGAKSRICRKTGCNPQCCDFPRGHHERVISAVFDIASNHKSYTPKIICEYAEKYQVCPFMLEMEMVWFADVVVCDYNYVFDPAVSAKLGHTFSGNDVILVDEAHNLIDRVRNAFSAEIDMEKLKSVSGLYKGDAINSFIDFVMTDRADYESVCEPMSSQSVDGIEREVNSLLSGFQEHFEDSEKIKAEIFSLSDSLKMFAELVTQRSDDYIVCYNDKGNPEIFMVNTALMLKKKTKELGVAVMFSATLFPEEYYKYMLGAGKSDFYLSFPSPFDAKNLLVLGYSLSTKYSERETTLEEVVSAVWTAGSNKVGNYIAFFPSYQYMNMAVNTFVRLFPDEKVIYQKPGMTENEKREFLNEFSEAPQKTLFAFAVLGGAFSEGIDLAGDKLSGAAVVGLGSLPPSRKGTLVAQYFSDQFFDGEKFAYHYPGLNKVFQAGGRVIRSESDRGYLLIIDDRFLTEDNIDLLPDSWSNVKKVKDNNDIKEKICDFWRN